MARKIRRVRRKPNTLLARLRRERGWSQFEVCRRTGINPTCMSHYENGLDMPGEHAHLFAELFDVPVSEFWVPPTLAEVQAEAVANG